MNILIDLIDTQGMYKGSGVYIRKVFISLMKYVDNNSSYDDIRFICTYDFNKKVLYDDWSIEKLSNNHRITLVDINGTTFADICKLYDVKTIFLGFGQQICDYDFSGVNARIICVLHDIFSLEFENTKLDKYIYLDKPQFWPIRLILKRWIKAKLNIKETAIKVNRYKAHIDLFEKNPNYQIVTVSNFSYYSLQNLLPFPKEKIHVLWSPEKEICISETIENQDLKNLILSRKKYLLLVSGNRELKNPHRAIDAFLRYKRNNPQCDLLLLTIGYKESKGNDHIVLPYLSDSDIEYAYMNCYALIYPTYFEGFGYPPLEVMKYKKPVLSSNVCSMPEVLENAPIWFSPFYTTDIYKAIDTLISSNYNDLCKKSFDQYLKVHKRQEEDLEKMIHLILK